MIIHVHVYPCDSYSMALQRLKNADDGFRKQLETKELSYSEKMREITDQYELRIAEEQHRVRLFHGPCRVSPWCAMQKSCIQQPKQIFGYSNKMEVNFAVYRTTENHWQTTKAFVFFLNLCHLMSFFQSMAMKAGFSTTVQELETVCAELLGVSKLI